MWWYQWLCWLLSASGVVCILIGHEHYSIDVVIGYFVTTRTFWWYHNMANTHVRARTRTHMPALWAFEYHFLFFLFRLCARRPTTTWRGRGGTRCSTSWRGTSRRRSPLYSRGRWHCRPPADSDTGWWRGGGTSDGAEPASVHSDVREETFIYWYRHLSLGRGQRRTLSRLHYSDGLVFISPVWHIDLNNQK